MKSLEELIRERKELDAQISKVKEIKIRENMVKVSEKLNSITDEQKDFLLSLIKHDRTSCDDSYVANGLSFGRDGDEEGVPQWRWSCRKCMLIEVLNGEHGASYDFSIEPDFWRVDDV